MQSQAKQVASRPAPSDRTHLAPFVFSDLSYDFAAIVTELRARYAARLDYINGFTGKPRRYWARAISRRIITETMSEASGQRHKIVWSRLPQPLPYTAQESGRLELLKDRMSFAPVTARGNADYKAAAGEHGRIVIAAQLRAYNAILEAAGVR